MENANKYKHDFVLMYIIAITRTVRTILSSITANF